MTLDDFREAVYAEFGPRLEYATPERMRAFIDRMYAALAPSPGNGQTLDIPRDPARDYDQIVSEFLAHSLAAAPEQALILLWLFTCEIYFSNLSDRYHDQFTGLLDGE